MSILSDLGDKVFTAVTGQSLSDVQATATAAEQQLTLAFETLIAENAIIILEMALVIVLLWKIKRKGV